MASSTISRGQPGSSLADSPTFTQQVDQTVFIEPLGGPTDPANALDRFPDALYNKSPETHFIRFMYSLLGPAGVGWIKKEYLDAKLELYAQGFSGFDIESYYGDPFQFGRILLEQLPDDPGDLLTRAQWDVIKSHDESYRGRAITYFNAVRAGGTPPGIELAAQSGLNHAVFVIENYKALFDANSDDPLNLPHYGQSTSTEEFVIVPRQDTSQTEMQIISFASVFAVTGVFTLTFEGQTTASLDYTADNFDVQAALEALGSIGVGGVTVSGGPNPNPFTVTFAGSLSSQDVPTLQANSSMTDQYGDPVELSVRTLVGGVAPVDETVLIPDEFKHNMQTAVDFLRPLNSLPTSYQGTATRTQQDFTAVHASSSYVEAVSYVTGSDQVSWPPVDTINWVEPGKEKEARRIQGDLQQHYTSYHNVSNTIAYTDVALSDPNYNTQTNILGKYKSEHIGQYSPKATTNFAFLSNISDNGAVFSAVEALPSCSQPIEVTTQGGSTNTLLVGGTISADAIDSDGSGNIALQKRLWWSSLERTAPNADLLEIDFGVTRVVNWVSFDISTKPVAISLDYDILDVVSDNSNPRHWAPVSNWTGATQTGVADGTTYISVVIYNPTQPPWTNVRIYFRDANQHNITTRFLRLTFARPNQSSNDPAAPFLDPTTGLPIAYSVDVKNLRVGRYTGAITPTWTGVNV